MPPVERTPELEPDYLVLIRDRDRPPKGTRTSGPGCWKRRFQRGWKVQRKGERFSLIDPRVAGEPRSQIGKLSSC